MNTTFVQVNTYTHSVNFVTDKMLVSLRRIIAWSGLDPSKLTDEWKILERGVRVWLDSKDLVQATLEIFDPRGSTLVGRWDFDICYSFGIEDDGAFWVDVDAIKNAIKKCGLITTQCLYRIIVTTKPGRPHVPGWGPAQFFSTNGFARYCIGTTIGASQLASGVAYWRRIP
jgi:hypothetical protein